MRTGGAVFWREMSRTQLLRLATGSVVLVLLACGAAALSNAVAGPERRLEWFAPGPAAAAPATASSGSTSAPGPGSPASTSTASNAGPAGAAASSGKPWKEATTGEIDSLFDSGALFLDARRSSEFRQGHIPRARSVPVWEAGLDDKIKALFSELPDQSVPIVVYCNGGECEDSHELGQRLYLVGFDGVRVYRDGFPDWVKRKRPVSTGATP